MNDTTPSRAGPSALAAPWARLTLLALAVPQLLTGLWAVTNPDHWYRTFPGFGPLLVAALALAALIPLAVAFSARGTTTAQRGHKTP